jgi:hypothetical protein
LVQLRSQSPFAETEYFRDLTAETKLLTGFYSFGALFKEDQPRLSPVSIYFKNTGPRIMNAQDFQSALNKKQ